MQVTVVMPVFNCGRFVREAIDSVVAQTHRDWTLLILNDGSTDDTAEVCNAVAAIDSRIRVIHRPNRGIAHAMNEALSQVTTEWVVVMHGDDVMEPNRIERQLAFIGLNLDVAVISSIVRWIDASGQEVGQSRSALTTPQAVADARMGNGTIAFAHPAVMFRQAVVKAVGGYRQEFWPAEDTELWNRIADAGHGVLVQEEPLLKYRIHASSASMNFSDLMIRKLRWMGACVEARRAGCQEPTWNEHLACERDRAWPARLNEWRKHRADVAWYHAMLHRSGRRFGQLMPSLAAALALRPGTYLPRVLPRLGGRAA